MKKLIFWNRVNEQIKAHKITREKFTEHIGVPLSTFYGWQQHNRLPDVETAFYIATALGVSLEYLVFGEDEICAKMRMKQTERKKLIQAEAKKLVDKLQKKIVGL